LFDYYLETTRSDTAGTIEESEARRVRAAIDGAATRILTMDAMAIESAPWTTVSRDTSSAFVDSLLSLAASVPERVTRRLERAFDDQMKSRHD
jgi:hypothetical protein